MTITLPEKCRAGLAELNAARKLADERYSIAITAAITAIGLDPSDKITVNMETGVVSVAVKEE